MEKKIGVEIEFTGVTREEVVQALENLFTVKAINKVSVTADDSYEYQKIKDNNGDYWLVVRDRSIKPESYAYKKGTLSSESSRFDIIPLDDFEDSTNYMVELVSPALTSKSLPILFSIVDVIKSIGGIVNSSCGLHVHVDKPTNFEDIRTLFKRFYLEQESVLKHFNVKPSRLQKYCMQYSLEDESLLDNIISCESEEEFFSLLYRYFAEKDEEGSYIERSIRYYALNFYSILNHNTIEFRIFNSTLSKVDIAKILDWVIHFVYSAEEYNNYIPVLGGILANEMQVEVV